MIIELKRYGCGEVGEVTPGGLGAMSVDLNAAQEVTFVQVKPA